MRAWCRDEITIVGVNFVPVQANMALSERQGTLRGLPYQVAPALEAKSVRCTAGTVFDVVVDVRRASPTFLRWHGKTLTAENGRMLYLPEACAHDCISLEDRTEIYNLTSTMYATEFARGNRFNDSAVSNCRDPDQTYMSREQC